MDKQQRIDKIYILISLLGPRLPKEQRIGRGLGSKTQNLATALILDAVTVYMYYSMFVPRHND